MRQEIGTFEAMEETLGQLDQGGLLLVTGKQGNPMTIGWGTLGIIWGRPVFCVLVRPSRYSFQLIENLDYFTVNVPPEQLREAVNFCGTRSGRDTNKAEACDLSLKEAKEVPVPYIEECPLHYECRIIHKHSLNKSTLESGIIKEYYPGDNLHTVYYGRILGVYRGRLADGS